MATDLTCTRCEKACSDDMDLMGHFCFPMRDMSDADNIDLVARSLVAMPGALRAYIKERPKIIAERDRLRDYVQALEEAVTASGVVLDRLKVDGFTTVGSIWDEDMSEAVSTIRAALARNGT